MNNYWISWYHAPKTSSFELYTPWWISGYRVEDESPTICAAVKADTEDSAKEVIRECYDTPPKDIEWRFVTEFPQDESPYSDRFIKQDWMQWPEEVK